MREFTMSGWRWFVGDDSILDINKSGKWMYFFREPEGLLFAEKMCRIAVKEDIVVEAKCRDNPMDGVACFYLNCDDEIAHKKVISFFLEHNMIRKTKSGKLYDESFKLDRQTRAGEYQKDFKAEIKLSQFIDLFTGEWVR